MARDVRLIRSPLSVAGMVLTTISAAVFLVVFLADLFGFHTNPYIGILFFIILPGIFLLGLVLIPLGAWVERRRRQAGRPPSEVRWPVIDLNDPNRRTAAVIVFALTMANIVIVSLAAYRGVEYMDTPEFCGVVCHVPMHPEWAARESSPHARVACIECHVGPGATSFARSKLAGTRRVVAVMFNTFPRPIPPPLAEMRPATETCENCHWPERFFGDRLRRITEYADDETNSESVTTLQLHLGGVERPGRATGIHWHTDPAVDIQFVAGDEDQEMISYVRVRQPSGDVREYYAEGVTPDQIAGAPRHRMDCMDCHNRPAHQIAATPAKAVDEAITRGEIPRNLPFVHREAVGVLKAQYPTQQAALDDVARTLGDFYAHQASLEGTNPFTADQVSQAVAAVQSIVRRSVFPDMHVGFGTYPSQIGHTDALGCFRCHDEGHKTSDGRTISQDCDTCHAFE